jgi:glucose/arabinose dehydrogenase
MPRHLKPILLLSMLAAFVLLAAVWRPPAQAQEDAPPDWQSDWALSVGFAIDIDTDGYNLPTAIAFVPHPGTNPDDPLFFVGELAGQIKVVTNDRSVHVFADNIFQRQPEEELPHLEGETGLAGLCLAPDEGYVFATYAYPDADGLLRNGVVRFDSQPGNFSLTPTGQHSFNDLLAQFEAAASHQIGSCQVLNGAVYMGVGDGFRADQSQKTDSVLGKMLRMSLDGQPLPDSPFFTGASTPQAADFIWAYGFRNPFGLKAIGERLFVADNGRDLDRFVEVRPGENYGWDGTDWSIGSHADVALAPDIGPAQMDYLGDSPAGWPEVYTHSFYIAMSRPEVTGLLRMGYPLEQPAKPGTPDYFLKYQGATHQVVVGVAVGPDGLYFTPLLPDAGGRSPVFRVTYNPAQPHPYLMTNSVDPQALMQLKGCFSCHTLYGEGGTAGPTLDPLPLVKDLRSTLNSQEYLDRLAEVDQIDQEPYRSYGSARAAVLQATGDERLRTWMIYHIVEPRFDNPNSQMPNLGLTEVQAAAITDYLLRERSLKERLQDEILQYVPAVPRPRDLFYSFGLGAVASALGLALAAGAGWLFSRRTRRKRTAGTAANSEVAAR